MRPHGRARVSSKSPQAFAVCDQCGFLYNHVDLAWQKQWAGNRLINLKSLVCRRCQDVPNQQLRALILPPDPMPVLNPRVQDYAVAETGNRVTSAAATIDPVTGIPIPQGQLRITENDDYRVTQTTGAAPGSLNNEPGTDPNAPGNADPGLPYGFDEVPKTGE